MAAQDPIRGEYGGRQGPGRAGSAGGTPRWLIPLFLLLLAIGAGLYVWYERRQAMPTPRVPSSAESALPAEPVPPPPPAVPDVRYPPPVSSDTSPLPPIEKSDGPITEALTGQMRRDALGKVFNLQDMVRRFVVTVDNLPREIVPSQMTLVQRPPGRFGTARAGGETTLAPANARRYEPFVKIAETVDAKIVVGVYARFYPLMQQEYRALGYPKGEFNDKVVDAIDNMLAAPEIEGPVKLVQPKVLYQFADPELESLSAGQKIMIRIGPANAARVKTVLRALRNELTAGAVR